MKHLQLSLLATTLSMLALAPAARPDKIYFKASEGTTVVEQRAADFIEGKIVSESDKVITVKIGSGEIQIQRTLIGRIQRGEKSDRIYFKPETRPASVKGPAPDYIEGKVISQGKDSITIRVEGGEIEVARSMVARIEVDGLSVKDIEAREAASKERLVEANKARRMHMVEWAEASEKMRQECSARESEEIRIVVDFKGILPTQVFKIYDPIFHRIDLEGLARAVEDFLRVELRRLSKEKFEPAREERTRR